MGLLDQMSGKGDDLAGRLAGQFGGSQQGGLIGATAKLIGGAGGLGAFVQLFQQKGLGDAVNSWVSTGENRSISPEDVERGLGSDRVREVAHEAGVSEAEASQGLASLLPQLVDKLTPDGKLPDSQTENQSLSQLASRFLGRS